MNIPRSTLQNHLSGINKGFRVGRPSKFSEAQERTLVDFIIKLAEYGYPATKEKLRRIATTYAKLNHISINGRKWRPGEDWLIGYV